MGYNDWRIVLAGIFSRNRRKSRVASNNTNKILDLLYGFRLSKYLIYQVLKSRAANLVVRITPHLDGGELVLDIGPASCTVTELLRQRGVNVIPLDVQNYSIVESILPVLYDGDTVPFVDDRFDVSLILFVLHHTYEPEKLLLEALRVSKRIIVYEDIVLSPVHKVLTSAADMLINLEFYDQPHSNKQDEEWRTLFRALGLRLLHSEYRSYGLVFRHALYVLEK